MNVQTTDRTPHAGSAIRTLLLSACVACLAISAGAQGRGPGGPPGGGSRGGPGGGGMGGFGGGVSIGIGGGSNRTTIGGNTRVPNPQQTGGSTESQGGLQLGPAGRWWDNKDFARTIGLDSRQQKRLDEVFDGNKDTLVKLYKSLQHEESQLEKLTRSRELDENQIFQQIDRVTVARGELEKANAHRLLQIRKELTPEQTSRLDDLRPQTVQ